MLFDTPVYFCFLALVVLIYWRLNWRAQNRFLLAASYFFYGWWDWRFMALMFASTAVDFVIAQKIENATDKRLRKRFLIASLVINLGVLGAFKYLGFFIGSFRIAAQRLGMHDLPLPFIEIILPPGISFYTFQEIAYIVDVYRGQQRAARRFGEYALFVSLFPHLIAGPIQRPHHLLTQVQQPRRYDSSQFFDGLMLIALGLFRKCVIADQFAALANAAFGGRLGYGFIPSFTGAFAFAFQIYGDFSGYTDLARGSAKLLGFEFMINFRQPYLAATLQDFWRRWHISLSTWLRDYLYIPLGGSRKGRWRTYGNLMLTMLLGGLWHGANWTFVVWGAIHGIGLALERFASERGTPALTDIKLTNTKLANFSLANGRSRLIPRLLTLAAVGVAWIFFRARTIAAAARMIGEFGEWNWRPGFGAMLAFMAVLAAVTISIDLMLEAGHQEYLFQDRPLAGLAMAGGLTAATVLFSAVDTSAFIYFQF